MKRFIFAPGGVSETVEPEIGVLGCGVIVNGKLAAGLSATNRTQLYKNTFYFILGCSEENGGDINIPINTNHLTYSVTEYSAGQKFSAAITIPEPTVDGHYTIILAKKGTKFNERNKWTATVPVKVGESAETIGTKLAKYFAANGTNLNITSVFAEGAVTIESSVFGEDYEVVLADDLMGAEVEITHAEAPVLDAAWVNDFAAKCAADAGYSYTYQDLDINPGFPFDIQKGAAATVDMSEYAMVNIRFAVPRDNKTVDEVVHQTLHILTTVAGSQTIKNLLVDINTPVSSVSDPA